MTLKVLIKAKKNILKVLDIFHLSNLPEPKFKALQANKMINLNRVETSLKHKIIKIRKKK